ncbi:MAG: AI-2E family transporter [Myxococcaceae bacterium]|nr:AI-2E family transporter [Myxococcaceae bacterium]MCI0671970.1 AI-2E family transporter [Myxococcaceae bacterium]
MDVTGTPPAGNRKRLVLLAGLWLFLLLVAVVFRGVLLVFAGAALIAYLIAPGVNRLSKVRIRGHAIPRWVAVLLLYALFFVGVYLFVVALVPNIYAELVRISGGAVTWARTLTPERIEEIAAAAEAWLRERGIPAALSRRSLAERGPEEGVQLSLDLHLFVEGLIDRAAELLEENVGDIVAVSRGILTAVLAGIFMTFFMLMVAAFLSIDSRAIGAYARSLVPREYAEDVQVLAATIDRSLAGVVRGQVTICLVNGALTFLGLVLFQVKFAFLLATIATFLSLIPIFGTIISSVPIVLIGLSGSFGTGAAILAWIIGIHALEAYVLNPKIMGSAARIHPVVVAFALIAGERSYGLVGALFAVPVAAILVACFDFMRKRVQAT